MWRWLWLMFALAEPPWAQAAVRTVFVGIDHYRYDAPPYSTQPDHDPDFHDLSGAVADVAMVKAALGKAFNNLPTRNLGGGRCGKPSDFHAGGFSVTLLDACATRLAILGVFSAAVAASRPGDIVLFYYAGHGSQIDDDTGVEYNGRNDTIVPADARIDDAPDHADILGVELRAIIDRKPPGVRVVTIFDSCNSGKATRGLIPQVALQARLAPPPRATMPRPKVTPGVAADRVGDVHLAAAADGVAANELALDGTKAIHGVFSYAISQALVAAGRNGGRPVSYADIFGEASRTVTRLGFGAQQPQAAGDLNDVFLGEPAVAVDVEPVSRDDAGDLVLGVGRLSGVTAGSVYGLFATSAEAGGAGAPSVTATVGAGVAETSARLVPSGPAPEGRDLWARELTHRFASGAVKMKVDPAAARAAEVTAALGGLDAIELTDQAPAYVFTTAPDGGVRVLEATGAPVGDRIRGDLDRNTFADAIVQAATRIARYHEVLALAASATGTPPRIWIGGPNDTGPPATGGARWPATAVYRTPFTPSLQIALTNTAPEGRYVYLIDLEADRSLTLVYPVRGEQARLDPPLRTVIVPPDVTLKPTSPGRSQLLLLTTDTAIDPTVFDQAGVGRGVEAGANALERLLRAAANGSRGADGPAVVADWGAALAVVDVVPSPP